MGNTQINQSSQIKKESKSKSNIINNNKFSQQELF